MKKRTISALLCIIVLGLIVFSLSGSKSSGGTASDLLQGISTETPTVNTELLSHRADNYTDLSLRLLSAAHSDSNTLIAPLSTIYGLSMTANGAGGETLAQIENAVGMSTGEMNEYLYSYTARLNRTGDILSFASSLWFSEHDLFQLDRGFLKTCAAWYDAEIYETEFNDAALDAMNTWTREISGYSMDCPISGFRQPEGIILLATLLFDGHWETPFTESENREGIFTREDGTELPAVYMSSAEDLYLENDLCSGFLKPYWSDSYIFAALLPRNDITVEEFLSAMDGQTLSQLFAESSPATVHVTMPKFSASVSLDMIQPLMELGVTDVFTLGKADLTGIGGGHLCITDIRQEARITVDEIGTRAVAVSAIAAYPASAHELLEDKYVKLDRPFVYMILETGTYTPIFLGTVMSTA